MYDILIYVLKAWSQKQDSSLAYLEGDGRGWTGRGGEGCPVELLQYLFTYLQFYTVSVAVLWLFILLFLLWFRYPPIFFLCFFCACLLYPFGGGPCCIST